MKTIDLSTLEGPVTVPVIQAREGLALHRSISKGRGYTISHVASGLSILDLPLRKRNAVLAFEALLEVGGWERPLEEIRTCRDTFSKVSAIRADPPKAPPAEPRKPRHIRMAERNGVERPVVWEEAGLTVEKTAHKEPWTVVHDASGKTIPAFGIRTRRDAIKLANELVKLPIDWTMGEERLVAEMRPHSTLIRALISQAKAA